MHRLRGIDLLAVYLQHNKELADPRGRTPLHLAVTLGYLDCVKSLLRNGCDANVINKDGWNGKVSKLMSLRHVTNCFSFKCSACRFCLRYDQRW